MNGTDAKMIFGIVGLGLSLLLGLIGFVIGLVICALVCIGMTNGEMDKSECILTYVACGMIGVLLAMVFTELFVAIAYGEII